MTTAFRAFFACFRTPGDERFLALFFAARFFVPPLLDEAGFFLEEADFLGADFFFVAFFAADFLVVFLAAMVTPFEFNGGPHEATLPQFLKKRCLLWTRSGVAARALLETSVRNYTKPLSCSIHPTDTPCS
jgi:hypothetical protein